MVLVTFAETKVPRLRVREPALKGLQPVDDPLFIRTGFPLEPALA
jgi:hypothetical protein